MATFKVITDKLQKEYEVAMTKGLGDNYSRLLSIFEAAYDDAREYIQQSSKVSLEKIINKLKRKDEITEEDKQTLRTWIVGDAQHYVKLENSVEDWKKELNRLMSEINQMSSQEPNATSVMRFGALLRDAQRNLSDLFFYVQQKERVDRFSQSIEEIDEEEREILIGLLEQKLKSPHF